MNFDEQYKAYKRASKMISPLPSSLLVSLAGCYINAGKISPDIILKSKKMLQDAFKKEESIEAAVLS